MENKLIDRVARTLSVELPYAESMDGYLEQILPLVRPLGEDLFEEEFYVNRPWLEMRDDVHFHQAVLHFFNEEGEYLRSVDGDVTGGSWRYMAGANKLMIQHGKTAELYDLAFLDGQFFVLKKHGDQERQGRRKYTFFIFEPLGKRLEWRDAMILLYRKSQSNNSFYMTIAAIVLAIIAIFFVLSLW